MYASYRGRQFFFAEIRRIDHWHFEQCPESELLAEEADAGIRELSEAFGFSAVLDTLAKGDFEKEDYIKKLSVYRVYGKIQYHAHLNAYQKRLRDLMQK